MCESPYIIYRETPSYLGSRSIGLADEQNASVPHGSLLTINNRLQLVYTAGASFYSFLEAPFFMILRVDGTDYYSILRVDGDT